MSASLPPASTTQLQDRRNRKDLHAHSPSRSEGTLDRHRHLRQDVSSERSLDANGSGRESGDSLAGLDQAHPPFLGI